MGKPCWLAVPCSQLGLLYIVCSHLPGTPLTQISLTGLSCEGEGAVLPLSRNVRNPPTPRLCTPRTGWNSSVTSSPRRKQTPSASVRDAQGPSPLPLPAPRSCIRGEKNSPGSGWAWTQQVWGFQGGVRWFRESYQFSGRSLWATLKTSLNGQFPETPRLGRHWMITPLLTTKKQRSKINVLR